MNSSPLHSISEIPETFPVTHLNESLANTSTGIWASIQSMSLSFWIIVILILALLGINIFKILGEGTQVLGEGTQKTAGIINKIFGPIIRFFGVTTIDVAKETISGAQTGVDVIADATIGVLDKAESVITKDKTQPVQTSTHENGSAIEMSQNINKNAMTKDTLYNALNESSNVENGPMADDGQGLQTFEGKAGWCFIGAEKNNRTCMEIGVNDTCMSGDIFPTQDVCVNPSLRA